MNSLDSQIADLQASIRQGIYNEEGGVKPMELVGIAQRELARQGQEALDTLTRAKAVLVDQYNTKIGLINTLMGWKKMDYDAASGQYNQDFSNALGLMQVVQGRMDEADKEANAVKDSAGANLSIITKAMTDSGKIWNDLDASVMAQIYKLEVQAGLPRGITQAIYNNKAANKKESFHIVSDDQTQATVFYTDGTSSTFSTGLKAGGGGGFTDWQQYQMAQDVKTAAEKKEQEEKDAIEKRDAAAQKYIEDLASKVLDNVYTREEAKTLFHGSYPEYDINAIYDFIPDSMDPGSIKLKKKQ